MGRADPGVAFRGGAAPKRRRGERRAAPVRDEWGPVIYALVSRHNFDPTRFGQLTYPMLVTILERGRADAGKADVDAARAALRSVKAGLYKWE